MVTSARKRRHGSVLPGAGGHARGTRTHHGRGPTVLGMAADGARYQGFLYAGLMITPDGTPKVIEFNCGFGEPEAQPVLMRPRGDLAALCRRALGKAWRACGSTGTRAAVGVVTAAGGYPLDDARGKAISRLADDLPDTRVLHAGTALDESVTEAQARAYERVARVGWEDASYRRDIEYRTVAREKG